MDAENAQLKHNLKAMKSENLRLQKYIARTEAKHVTEINKVKATKNPTPPAFIVNIVGGFMEVAERIIASDDSDAKGVLRQLLENSTVANIVGSSAATLLTKSISRQRRAH